MSAELLEIQPPELKFIFELKKQCSCSVRLVNKSNNHVAFKVKTTSPKKYCVRPNTGIIKPKSACDFTVTMQAQKVAPPDMICKDKFLVQCTVVSAGTTDEDINSSMFAKDNGRYTEENKLRVILIRPTNSPILSPINGTLRQVPPYEASILKDQVLRKFESFTPQKTVTKDEEESKMKKSEVAKPAKDVEYITTKKVEVPAKDVEYETMKEVEVLAKTVEYTTTKDVEGPAKTIEYETMKEVEEPAKTVEYTTTKDVDEPAKAVEYETMKDVEGAAKDLEHETTKEVEEPAKTVEYTTMKDVVVPTKDIEYETTKEVKEPAMTVKYTATKYEEEPNLVNDNEMKSKINELESKLSEAEVTISKLTEERRRASQDRESLRKELALLRTKRGARKVQAGFPFLFVCMVALIGVVVGYLIRS
ncbi:Vesicle-associated protein 2-2, N-terminally processed like [Actinidia chinensis var. chinensis]|uniref:Vesicle-associated protein 2-2, N-terminally processed like n=1 Tax=Actinidia chinensis var. chinensis TaxID=1590841 RepID=A0A2R6QLB7_ACTCC|nr:Vesicle-associated protein 2-2, N-terminally processed like [Actinidia chinensis var. chinensis]